MEIRKLVFWVGVGGLVAGVILFGYGSVTVSSLFDKLRRLYTDPAELAEAAASWGMGISPFQVLEQQMFLMQLFQLVGFVMAVIGAVVLVYGAGRDSRASFSSRGLSTR